MHFLFTHEDLLLLIEMINGIIKSSGMLLCIVRTLHTVTVLAEKMAQSYQVPVARRHVFIDNETDEQYLTEQFDELIQIAHAHGSAIAIGHPYPETIKFLKQRLKSLKEDDVQLVFASELTVKSELSIASGLFKTGQ